MNNLKLSPRGSMVLQGHASTRLQAAILHDLIDANQRAARKVRVKLHQLTALTSAFANAKPQTQTIGAHLYTGQPITKATAADMYRCRSLSSRISELQAIGWVIEKRFHRDPLNQLFASYHFAGFKGN